MRLSAGIKGKSAPATLGGRPKLAGSPQPWQRGRTPTPTPKSPSPGKAVRPSPRHHLLSPDSDTSSGLGTPVESDSDDSSSSTADVHPPVQPGMRRVSFRGDSLAGSHGSNQGHHKSSQMDSPFVAASQIAHPVTHASGGQGRSQDSPGPQGIVSRPASMVQLPRADVLVIGGDLAYPNPSNETYEQRFFRPFEAALPPPPHVRPGRLVVYKPDLPGAADLRHTSSSQSQAGVSSVYGDTQPPSR